MTQNTETNVTPFAKLIGDFLGNVNSGQGISAKLLVAVADMEATFSLDWLKRFHVSEGKDKTTMLHAALNDLYPSFADLVETAKLKSADLSPRMLDRKADCQKQLKSLENIMREAFFGVSFLLLKECDKVEVKNHKRIRYVIDGAWNNDIGDTFDGIVNKGKKACQEAGWIAKPATATRTNAGSSMIQIANECKAAGTDFPSVFVQLCQTLKTALSVRKLEELSDAEKNAFEALEGAVIRTVYGSEDGTVDIKMIADLYNPKRVGGQAVKTGKGGVSLSAHATENDKVAA